MLWPELPRAAAKAVLPQVIGDNCFGGGKPGPRKGLGPCLCVSSNLVAISAMFHFVTMNKPGKT